MHGRRYAGGFLRGRSNHQAEELYMGLTSKSRNTGCANSNGDS